MDPITIPLGDYMTFLNSAEFFWLTAAVGSAVGVPLFWKIIDPESWVGAVMSFIIGTVSGFALLVVCFGISYSLTKWGLINEALESRGLLVIESHSESLYEVLDGDGDRLLVSFALRETSAGQVFIGEFR